VTFANPIGLWGLISLPIIFALHLLRERQKRYTLSSLSLWSFMDEEVSGSRASRVPLTWLLLLDLLVATVLSLAWAQPHIQLNLPAQEARQLVVLLDVSSSMLATDVLPNRFTAAQQKALVLISSLGPNDVVTVVAFGSRPYWVGDTRQINLDELSQKVRLLTAGDVGSSIEPAFASVVATLDPNIPSDIYILTDAAFDQPRLNTSPAHVEWLRFGSDNANQAILDLSAIQSGLNTTQVFARIVNYDDRHISRVVSLLADGYPIDSRSIDLEPDSTISQLWTIDGLPELITVQLTGTDLLAADDKSSYMLRKSAQLKIALIASDSQPYERALRSIQGISLRVLKPEENVSGTDYDLVIYRGALPERWPDGEILVIDPPRDNDLLSVGELEIIESIPIPANDSYIAEIDFSGVQWGQAWSLSEVPSYLKPLLQAGEVPIYLRGRSGLSNVHVFLADIRTGNLAKHPAFPIMMALIVQNIYTADWPPTVAPGELFTFPLKGKFSQIHITDPGGKLYEWTSDFPVNWDGAREAGIYRVDTVDPDGRQETTWIGVNAGHTKESNVLPRDWPVDNLASIGIEPTNVAEKVNLMPWLLGLSLILLVIEASVAWR